MWAKYDVDQSDELDNDGASNQAFSYAGRDISTVAADVCSAERN
jgi:hypothetical protein